MKSLDQIEPRTPISSLPFTIDQPGSYYFVTNLTGDASGGITIAASGVTLDLMGFELAGGTGSAIKVSGTQRNIAIRNGVVRDWSGDGIDLFTGASNCQVERLRVSGNAGHGVTAGMGSVVRDCTAFGNGSQGIRVNSGSSVQGCTARSNGGFGFRLIDNCLLQSSVASSNISSGVFTGNQCMIKDCVAGLNAGSGIVTGADCAIQSCTATANGPTPIALSAGIQAGTRNRISDCTATDNLYYGIWVNDHCLVSDNSVQLNLVAGIFAASTRNQIDNNKLAFNTIAIRVTGTSNTVHRNTASESSSGNYSIVGGNDSGPIGTAATATSPWANISN
jgi:parallel beta-helix repeat protein